MSSPSRPRPPRHAGATRRLALVRIGAPTLAVLAFFGAGQGMAITAGSQPVQRVSALLSPSQDQPDATVTGSTVAVAQVSDGPTRHVHPGASGQRHAGRNR